MAEKKKKKRKRKEWKFQDFRVIFDLPERLSQYLREWLHLEKAEWDFCIDKLRQGKPYTEWRKSKGKGKGFRYFAAPCDELKRVQRAILHRILMAIPVHFARHGNQPGSSILTNVQAHIGFAKAVFSIDIINAFPTVFRSRVKANLHKPFEFSLKQFAGVAFTDDDREKMLEAICDLVSWHDRLPQGPPTSPRLLDIVCMKMDQDIYRFLQENSTPFQSYRYTAWCDDLTISSDNEIPEEVRQKILELVKENGFIPHDRKDKTKYFSPETGEVPVVTGLVLNPDGRKTCVPDKVNQFRARLHGFLKLQNWSEEVLGQVNGTLGYIRQIYPAKLPSKIRAYVEKIELKLREQKLAALESAKSMPASPKAVPVQPAPQAKPEEEKSDAAEPRSEKKKTRKKKKAEDVLPQTQALEEALT